MDLVLTLTRREGSGLWIPNLDMRRWEASDPEKHVALLNGGTESLRRTRRRAIRLLKAWNKQWSSPAFSSFHLSAMALEYIVAGMGLPAALHAAQTPAPSIVLKNTGADLPAAQVDDLLEAWENARINRSTAYLNSTIDTHSLGGWSPSDLQLTDARNAAATQIARMANLDPVWVGAGVPGSSLTYSNRTDLMRQLLDLSLVPVMRMITERLSMDDVTPRGHTVEFETDALLKANVPELANVIAAMAPLGVITTDEARRLLDLVEMGAEE